MNIFFKLLENNYVLTDEENDVRCTLLAIDYGNLNYSKTINIEIYVSKPIIDCNITDFNC